MSEQRGHIPQPSDICSVCGNGLVHIDSARDAIPAATTPDQQLRAAAERVLDWADHQQPWNPAGDFDALYEATGRRRPEGEEPVGPRYYRFAATPSTPEPGTRSFLHRSTDVRTGEVTTWRCTPEPGIDVELLALAEWRVDLTMEGRVVLADSGPTAVPTTAARTRAALVAAEYARFVSKDPAKKEHRPPPPRVAGEKGNRPPPPPPRRRG